MAYNGSGLFVIDSTGQPVAASTLIQASVFNALTADLATGLSTAIAKDGQTTITANLPMAGYRHTGVGNASARTMYAAAGQVQDGGLCYGTVGGTADAITLTLTPAITAYAAGQKFSFVSSGANTGAVTINVNSVGAKDVTKNGTTALAAGNIASGAVCVVVYDGTRFQLLGQMPSTMTGMITFKAGADIASAATIDLTAATGNMPRVTGTIATSAATMNAGQIVVVTAAAAWPLTYHATNMRVITLANHTCAAEEPVLFYKDGSGVVHVWPANAYATVGMPKGHLHGLKLSNNGTDATNDIDIAVGVARDSSNAEDIVLGSAITKRLDAAWAVGTNQGGLDTGSIANGTYHVFVIKRSDTDVVDVLFSASATAPTMPANYDYKRRIGSILRESGAIVAFVQDGDDFARATSVLDISANNPGTSAVTRTLSIPTGVRMTAHLIVEIQETAAIGPAAVYISDLSTTDSAPTAGGFSDVTPAANVASRTQNGAARLSCKTNTSAQVRSRVSNSAGSTTLYMRTLGWSDDRGRSE